MKGVELVDETGELLTLGGGERRPAAAVRDRSREATTLIQARRLCSGALCAGDGGDELVGSDDVLDRGGLAELHDDGGQGSGDLDVEIMLSLCLPRFKSVGEGLRGQGPDDRDQRQCGLAREREGVFSGFVRRDEGVEIGHEPMMDHSANTSLGELGSFAPTSARRVLFVCSANSARSQLAPALWTSVSEIPADSAGTHPANHVAPGAIAVAARHGLDLTGAVPRLVDDTIRDDDFIITVCDCAHEEYPAGTAHWSVPDPIADGTAAAFESEFIDLEHRIGQLAPKLLPVA
jgi:protein-tyrosine-phosphatase